MSLYQYITLGSSMSVMIGQIEAQHEAMRGFERGTSTPTIQVNGQFWTRTDYPTLGEAIMRFNGSAFVLFADPDFAQVNAGGTVAFAANQAMGAHKFTGLSAGSSAGDSVRYEQVLLLAGGTMTGAIAMGTHGITGLPDPTNPQDAATKHYVDGFSPSVTGTFAPPAQTTSGPVTVTLGFQPSALWVSFDNITLNGVTPNVYSCAAVFRASGSGLLVSSSSGPFTAVVVFNGTGFTLALPGPFNNFSGTLRYVAFR